MIDKARMKRLLATGVAVSILLTAYQPPLWAEPGTNEITVPIGTKIYCELDQRVTSKKKEFQVGDRVRVRVWRDVIIDGQVVIPRGSPVDARISMLRKSKVAGRKGKLEISADAVRLADGRELPLSGGYGKQGKGKMGLSVTLFALVAWPLIFLKGKQAILDPGVLFDAYMDQEFRVAAQGSRPPSTLDLSGLGGPDLSVDVLYDELEGKKKVTDLPMFVHACGNPPPTDLLIDRINGSTADSPVSLSISTWEEKDDCFEARASAALKPLVKQFRKGINRFDVAFQAESGRVAVEVILDIQL